MEGSCWWRGLEGQRCVLEVCAGGSHEIVGEEKLRVRGAHLLERLLRILAQGLCNGGHPAQVQGVEHAGGCALLHDDADELAAPPDIRHDAPALLRNVRANAMRSVLASPGTSPGAVFRIPEAFVICTNKEPIDFTHPTPTNADPDYPSTPPHPPHPHRAAYLGHGQAQEACRSYIVHPG